MNTAVECKSLTLNVPAYLYAKLASEAKAHSWSLNDYATEVLLDAMYYEPNEETREAIEEARTGKSAGTLDMSSFEAFLKSINDIE